MDKVLKKKAGGEYILNVMNKAQFDIHAAAHSSDAYKVLPTDTDHKKTLISER